MLKEIFGFSTAPSTAPPIDYYGKYTKWDEGRPSTCYSESDDKFLKDLSSWVSQAESSVESESRKEVESLFGHILHPSLSTWDQDYKDPSGIYEIIKKEGSKPVCIINLQEKSLTSLPTKLPRYDINIESLNLANNFLKKFLARDSIRF